MLDSVPRRVWLEYRIKRLWSAHHEAVLKWAFWLSLPLALGLYYPVTQYITHQEVKQFVNVSNLTVFYIVFLFYMAYFANQLLNRFTANKPYVVRLAGLFLFILALFFFLDAIGMPMRW